jgi:glycosyltransferase involved in cell wall biosynthesis
VKVGIDATELRPGAVGGVRTALRLLLDALAKHAPELEVTALAPQAVPVPHAVRLQVTGGPSKPRLWRRSFALRRTLRRLDLFHSPVTAIPSFEGPTYTATVHELPFVEDYRLEGTARASAQWFWLSRAMGRCAALFAPSRATFRQIGAAHPAAAAITAVVPHPAPPAPDHEQHTHDGSLLFVGRLEKRKCVEALLRGAASESGEIRLVGPHRASARRRIETAAERAGVRERVLFFGVVTDGDLDYLYRNACAVGLVSASEGFGFPVLEALSRGVPVIVARGTGAAEVGGEAALAVNPASPSEIAAALRMAADPAYRKRLSSLGPARALEFTPERTARGYAEVFLRAASG